MKTNKIVYYIATALLSVQMLMSAGMYFFNTAVIQEIVIGLGFPAFIVIPLGIAKVLGLTAIWVNKFKILKEFAYAGFLFNVILAGAAHLAVGDGEQMGAVIALILWIISYVFYKRAKL